MKILIDKYTFRARLEPAIMSGFPIFLALFAWFINDFGVWQTLIGILGSIGGINLLSQIGRDYGKKKELALYESWGGKPTTRLLRHRETTNTTLLKRRHDNLRRLLPNVDIPTKEDELADPNNADEAYDTCTRFLLEKTRDKKLFPLVFEENCNYGFRRNLWGMKPIGIILSLISLIFCIGLIIITYYKGQEIPVSAIACGSIDFILFLLWIFWITPDWVKIAADAFAERLIATCEAI